MVNSMTIKIRNISVNYIQYGSGSDVILLHGWGQNIDMMKPLGNELKNYRITILDLPGFGLTSEPDDTWKVEDYTDFLNEFLMALKIEKPILVGHSFGGRIAICYASKYHITKLVLFGAPCVRTKKELTTKEKLLKSIKKVPGLNKVGELAKNFIGSTDYKNASPRMREILVQIIHQDLSIYAKSIKEPTLLIWGDLDTSAPLADAKLLEKLLPDGGLVTLEGYTHYAYLEALPQVITILNKFL